MGKDTDLLEAARNGHLLVVDKILTQRAKRSGPLASLRRGPGANVQDGSGYSALHHAALNGHKEIVKLLLEHEASPNLTDDKGCSPLHLAAWTGNVHIVKLLICHGPSVTLINLLNKDRESALHCSAQYGHTEVVSLLLEYGCDPTIRNVRFESCLDLAAQYGRLETVETLVRTHPELVTQLSNPYLPTPPHTPLHLASRNGHKGVVELLLSSGMDVNVRSKAGSALHEAALFGKLDVAKLLLQSGVKLSIRNEEDKTVAELIKQLPPHVVQEIISLIRRHGESVVGEDSLPPIPVVPTLGSPYENVRLRPSLTSSPNHWLSDRRVSTTSALSLGSEEGVDKRHQEPWSKSTMEGSFLSEDSCCSQSRDLDGISVSSASSLGPRDRISDLYLAMTPSPGSNNKVSPTPPKKPPRRNLSVSPTQLAPHETASYEYLFLARSGARPREPPLRRGKSADQYVEMKARYSIMGEQFDPDENFQPVAITSLYENIPFRTTNPKRKLKRLQTEKGYENYDSILSRGDLPFKKVETLSREVMLEARHRVARPCPLSPTNYQQPPTPDHPPPSATHAENSIHERIRPLSEEYCNMKRRSRDMETETEEELLLVYPPDSAAVEEYLSDVPFAGLLKGSTRLGEKKAERPKTLRRLHNVYEKMGEGAEEPLLSPLNEQEEWAKISEIMASFGSDLLRDSLFMTELEKEFDARLGLKLSGVSSKRTTVGEWLQGLELSEYEPVFINSGFDNIDFLNGVLTEADLLEMGVEREEQRKKVLDSVSELRGGAREAGRAEGVEEWLARLGLEGYIEVFKKHLYTEMERVRNVWEVELSAVLEISKAGHRRRILASLPPSRHQPTLRDIDHELSHLKNSIQELEGRTGTLRHSHKKSRPAPQPPGPELQIREPSQLLVGVPPTLTAHWRHSPAQLLTSHVTYLAQYLGSTVVKELRGTESTMKSIQKLKKPRSEAKSSADIYLAISYRGVKFLTGETEEPVCEHEIRNIHCACQDAEDLTHFAYITKDHASQSHYCHVFCVQTMDQATEVILTLGQAFEVAYQMVLREAPKNGHTRSHSANQILESDRLLPTHARSHSVNGQLPQPEHL